MARFGRGAPFPRWVRPRVPDAPGTYTANAGLAQGDGQAFGLGFTSPVPTGRGTAFSPTILISGVVRPATALGSGLAPSSVPQVATSAGVASGSGLAEQARAGIDNILWVSTESINWVSGEAVDWD